MLPHLAPSWILAKLRIWQVPACKMEPQSGIIFMKPQTDPPAAYIFLKLLDKLGS